LQADSNYVIKIVALDAAKNRSGFSNEITVKTKKPAPPPDRTPPSVPGGLKVNKISTSGFTVQWLSATDNVRVKGYYVILNGKQVATVTTRNSYVFTGLLANQKYTIKLIAFDTSNNRSNLSNPLVVSTLKNPSIVKIQGGVRP
jgi:chitodextrinase